MAVQNFETINNASDVTTTRTILHEVIPITGSILSGTYGPEGAEENIKNFTHGMFQAVYDYPYLSSSANELFDLTIGYDEGSFLSGSVSPVQNAKKINVYNGLAQTLLGFTGSDSRVEIFESDLILSDDNNQMDSVFFINFSRLLTKDQIKVGSFSISLGSGSWATPFSSTGGSIAVLTDASASSTGEGTKNTNGGDYGVLYNNSTNTGQGVIFYQSGIAVISSSVFEDVADFYSASALDGGGYYGWSGSFTSASISASCDALRHRIYDLSFNNSTEINSTIYFCRAPHNKFNYSANPTYTSGSKIRVKSLASDSPLSFITTIGLYNGANELLAVAKLSEPLKKDPTNEVTLRVRLDY